MDLSRELNSLRDGSLVKVTHSSGDHDEDEEDDEVAAYGHFLLYN